MHNERPIDQKQIKQLQTKLEEAKASWYPEKKDLYKRLHKQEPKNETIKKKTYESHGHPSQATSGDRIYLLEPKLGIIASVRGWTLK